MTLYFKAVITNPSLQIYLTLRENPALPIHVPIVHARQERALATVSVCPQSQKHLVPIYKEYFSMILLDSM
jgi:hypothetical protein